MARRGSTAVSDRQEPDPDAPPLDPSAIDRAYRVHRAKRRARSEHHRRRAHAGRRFWIALALLVIASGALVVTTWHEIQQLFGL